jgi:mRNA-degrading endonuclease toxin of MazEF toxin-antitoxin module
LRDTSFAMCEQVRSLTVDRLGPQPFGRVSSAVLDSVEHRLRLLFGLSQRCHVDARAGAGR